MIIEDPKEKRIRELESTVFGLTYFALYAFFCLVLMVLGVRSLWPFGLAGIGALVLAYVLTAIEERRQTRR